MQPVTPYGADACTVAGTCCELANRTIGAGLQVLGSVRPVSVMPSADTGDGGRPLNEIWVPSAADGETVAIPNSPSERNVSWPVSDSVPPTSWTPASALAVGGLVRYRVTGVDTPAIVAVPEPIWH